MNAAAAVRHKDNNALTVKGGGRRGDVGQLRRDPPRGI